MADAAKTPPADPKETAVALKGLAPSVDEATLTTTVGAHGKLLRVKLDGLGGAHVVFASTRAAQRAAAALNGAVVQGQRIAAQHVRTFTKTTRPCRGFLEGKCRKGDQCKYWHGAPEAGSVPPPIATTAATTTTKKTKPVASSAETSGDDISGIPKASICRNFAKGNCVHADKCRFAHVLGAGALPPPPPASIPAPCSFFLAGRCTKGDECAFLHTDRPQPPPASKPTMCSYFAAGRCARGDQCAYLHETKPAAAAPVAAAVPAVGAKTPVVAAKPSIVAKTKPAKKTKATAVVTTPVTPTVGDRTCIECEKPGVASWICGGCDDALYCDECKTLVHRPKVMRSHTQEPLPALPTRPTCGECEKESASVECADCGVPYCASCDASVHQFKSLRGHVRTPFEDVPAPAIQKKTNDKPKKSAKAETALTPTPVTGYIDSVPQYDLPSESDSSDEEEEEDDEPQQQLQAEATPMDDSSSESEDEVEQESPAAAAMRAATSAATGYVESVPKYELSSESESSDDDNDEADTADDDDSVEEVKQSILKAAVVAVKQKILSPVKATTRPEALSSESSEDSDDDDFEDERPVLSPTNATPASKMPPSMTELSSESESDDDDPKPKVSAPTPKRKASVSSESSSDSDSDEDVPPPSKQQRVVAKAPPTPVARAPRTVAPAQNGKVGISAGSSHSLVKTIEAYAESDNTEVLHLDPNLNGFERLLAHDCAERLGLNHVSVGEGLERHITISRKGGAGAVKRSAAPSGATNGSKKQKRA